MAYAFDRVDKFIKKRDKDEKDELTRSFNTAPSPGSPVMGGVGESIERFQPQKVRRVPFNKTAAARASFAAAKKHPTIPGVIGSLKGDIESRKKELEGQIGEFKAREAKTTGEEYKVDPEEVGRAIRGGEGSESAYKRISGVLGRDIGRTIEPPKKESPIIPNTEYLKNIAGLKNLMLRGRGPTYTPGMAEFDVGVLASSPDFKRKISGLLGEQGELEKTYNKMYGKAVASAEKADKEALEAAKKSIRDYLIANRDTLTAEQEAEAEELTKRLEEIYSLKHPDIVAKKEELINRFKKHLEEQPLLAAKYTGGIGGDPRTVAESMFERWLENASPGDVNRYFNSLKKPYERGHEFAPEEAYDPEEISEFQKIRDLLGEGELQPKPYASEAMEEYLTGIEPGAEYFGPLTHRLITEEVRNLENPEMRSVPKVGSIEEFRAIKPDIQLMGDRLDQFMNGMPGFGIGFNMLDAFGKLYEDRLKGYINAYLRNPQVAKTKLDELAAKDTTGDIAARIEKYGHDPERVLSGLYPHTLFKLGLSGVEKGTGTTYRSSDNDIQRVLRLMAESNARNMNEFGALGSDEANILKSLKESIGEESRVPITPYLGNIGRHEVDRSVLEGLLAIAFRGLPS